MAKGKNGLMKGAAVVAAVAAGVALVQFMQKSRHAKVLKSAAKDTSEHVMAHARKLGKFSKGSYGKIVDTVLAEFGNAKALSKKELAELSKELKAGWEKAEKELKKKRH